MSPHGHEVLVETGAGAGIGADDNAYRAAGAKIAKTAAEVFERSDMIVKVKEPQPDEWVQLRSGQILYTYLHLAPDPEQTRACRLRRDGHRLRDGDGRPRRPAAARARCRKSPVACRSRPARRRCRRPMAAAACCWAACPACCPARSRSSAAAWSACTRPRWRSASAPTSPSSTARSRACASSTTSSTAASTPATRPSRRSRKSAFPPTSSSAPC